MFTYVFLFMLHLNSTSADNQPGLQDSNYTRLCREKALEKGIEENGTYKRHSKKKYTRRCLQL